MELVVAVLEIISPDVIVGLTHGLRKTQDVVLDPEISTETLTVTEIPESVKHKMSAPGIILRRGNAPVAVTGCMIF
jgi:hypothetical protein